MNAATAPSGSEQASGPQAGARPTRDTGHSGAALMLLAGMTSFQVGAVLAKGLFPVFGPTGMTGLRVVIAAIVLMAILRPRVAVFDPRTWKLLLVYGVSIAAMNFAFYIALARLPLGVAVALEFTGPLSLALIGSRRAIDLLWTALVLLGLFLLLRPDGTLPHLDRIGVIVAIAGGCCWIVYILAGTRVGRVVAPASATALGMSIGGTVLLPCLIPVVRPALHHPLQAVLAVCVAILSSAVPYVLDMMAMKRLKPRDLGILLSMEPMVGALAGLVLMGESLAPLRWVGVGCIVAASAGNVLAARQSRAQGG